MVYYIHADHLNTPRVITDAANNVVWRWENSDPFGYNLPDENSSGLGTFTFDLRFPGMVADRETGLFYNYLRDCYDPATGRYCQADPIGNVLYEDMAARNLFAARGPVDSRVAVQLYSGRPIYNHPYAYVEGNPVSFVDPLGLWKNPSDIYDEVMRDARRNGLPGAHNGPQDAYRHCLASCEMARENTVPIAQCLGWANEKKGDWTHNQQRGERNMDDHNNSLGFGFGKTAKSTQDCRNACMTAVQSGQTKTYRSGSTPGYWD